MIGGFQQPGPSNQSFRPTAVKTRTYSTLILAHTSTREALSVPVYHFQLEQSTTIISLHLRPYYPPLPIRSSRYLTRCVARSIACTSSSEPHSPHNRPGAPVLSRTADRFESTPFAERDTSHWHTCFWRKLQDSRCRNIPQRENKVERNWIATPGLSQ